MRFRDYEEEQVQNVLMSRVYEEEQVQNVLMSRDYKEEESRYKTF